MKKHRTKIHITGVFFMGKGYPYHTSWNEKTRTKENFGRNILNLCQASNICLFHDRTRRAAAFKLFAPNQIIFGYTGILRTSHIS